MKRHQVYAVNDTDFDLILEYPTKSNTNLKFKYDHIKAKQQKCLNKFFENGTIQIKAYKESNEFFQNLNCHFYNNNIYMVIVNGGSINYDC